MMSNESMPIRILYNLYQARRKLSPNKYFLRRLQSQLSTAWDEKNPGRNSWIVAPRFKFASVATAAILIACLVGTGVYAYNSPAVTEGTILYPLKQGLEKVEEITKTTPEAKVKFYLKKIERREAEKAVLVRRQQKLDKIDAQISRVAQKLETAKEQLEKVEVKDKTLRPKIQERLQKVLEQRRNNLEKREEKLQEKKDRLNFLNKQSTSSVFAPGSRRGEGRNGTKNLSN